MLKGKIPLAEEQRLKVFIYGPAGGGKTLAALQFPNAYIIDTAKETTRYWKQIQKTNSEVFQCSDPYEIIKELEKLRDEKHRFQTLIIDEITTLYQNIQTSWTDKFIAAQEERGGQRKAAGLLEDFGFRYWDKVKRDWRRLINTMRNLDMNVIVNAHQKDKYGSNQQVTGIAPDSEKNDEYVWDFVFRLIKRGKEYKAITEKQRILPVELDSEAKRFPKEFEWNYPNLLKFYNKEYIEKPTKNFQSDEHCNTKTAWESNYPTSLLDKAEESINQKIKEDKKEPKKSEDEKITTLDATSETNTSLGVKLNGELKNTTENNIDKIKILLKEEKITIKNFKIFLQDACKWKHVNVLSRLTEKEQKVLLDNWKTKIIPKYKQETENKKAKELNEEELKGETEEPKEKITVPQATNIPEQQHYEPDKPIRKDQREAIQTALKESGVSEERFLLGFMVKKWEEINQEGANNMIKNIKVMIGAL